jgi:hypothetical protein
MTTEQPSEKTRAFAALCDQIEAAGDAGTDGGAIVCLYLAAKLVRFDRGAYRVSDEFYLTPACIKSFQELVDAVDAKAEAV